MLVNVWDWRNSHVVATNKVSVKVKAMSFAEDGNCFVTVGNRHVKFWYLDYNHSSKNKFEPLPLMGRNAILGDQRNNYFCDVVCGRGDSKESTYAITKSGLLCEFNNRRLLNKWVELKVRLSLFMCQTFNWCLIFFSHRLNLPIVSPLVNNMSWSAVHRVSFDVSAPRHWSLSVPCHGHTFSAWTLPKESSFESSTSNFNSTRSLIRFFLFLSFNSSELSNSIAKMNSNKPKHADTVAVVYDDVNKIVTAIYSDRSIYFWSLGDIKRIGKLNSFFYHSSCIWDIEVSRFGLVLIIEINLFFSSPRRCIPPPRSMSAHYCHPAHFSPAPVMTLFEYGMWNLTKTSTPQQPK